MAKVTYEFDEDEDRDDIRAIIDRHKLIYALSEINELYRRLWNGKIYDEKVYISVKDNQVITDEMWKKAREENREIGETESYISKEYIEIELDNALDRVRHLLDY